LGVVVLVVVVVVVGKKTTVEVLKVWHEVGSIL